MTDPFPAGFFDRADESSDDRFYAIDRLVTHLDGAAIATVGALYDELGISGEVLDLCSSWISHFRHRPERLVALGMNATELAANAMAHEWVVQDLNRDPSLPFGDAEFDAVTCCVSVDYLTRPLAVFADVARVLRDGGLFVCTFSNQLCSYTKNEALSWDNSPTVDPFWSTMRRPPMDSGLATRSAHAWTTSANPPPPRDMGPHPHPFELEMLNPSGILQRFASCRVTGGPIADALNGTSGYPSWLRG